MAPTSPSGTPPPNPAAAKAKVKTSRNPPKQTYNYRDAQGKRVSSSSPPATEYIYVEPKGSQQQGNILSRVAGGGKARTPAGVPSWLGRREIILGAWLGAMVLVSVDEWRNNGILPRPSRLWWTTLTYAILMGVSIIDPLVPITNALAIGYTIVLAYQYFNGQGQFTATGGFSGENVA